MICPAPAAAPLKSPLCYGVSPCYGDSPCYGVSPCYGDSPVVVLARVVVLAVSFPLGMGHTA